MRNSEVNYYTTKFYYGCQRRTLEEAEEIQAGQSRGIIFLWPMVMTLDIDEDFSYTRIKLVNFQSARAREFSVTRLNDLGEKIGNAEEPTGDMRIKEGEAVIISEHIGESYKKEVKITMPNPPGAENFR